MTDHGVEGITCTIETEKETYHLAIDAPGEHMAHAAAIAVAVGEALEIEKDAIVRGVAAYVPAGSRMRVLRMPGNRIVLDDCYNASPQSVTAALEILAKTSSCERTVAVLGDMGELGELTRQAHYNVGALAAMLGIDCVVAIGKKASRIADGTEMNGGEVLYFETVDEAVGTVLDQLQPGTAMLVKASHAMHFNTLVDQLRGTYD